MLQTESWQFTATGDGATKRRNYAAWSYQLSVAGTGAVSATIAIEVRNDPNGAWMAYGTLTASGTTTASDAINGNVPWVEHRARCTAISGTGAVANVTGASADA